jgi:hypothetical protein
MISVALDPDPVRKNRRREKKKTVKEYIFLIGL